MLFCIGFCSSSSSPAYRRHDVCRTLRLATRQLLLCRSHFHYVIGGGILFCLFGAFITGFRKITGRLLTKPWANSHFWLFAIGFHLTFDSLHNFRLAWHAAPYLHVRTRRGWEIWNLIETIGVLRTGHRHVDICCEPVLSYFNGPKAGNDPWDAWTLECP